MSSTKMNNINRSGSMDIKSNRRGSMDTKFISTNRAQRVSRYHSSNPMVRASMSKTPSSVTTSLIDGALAIVNSPKSISKPRVMRRRGSLLTEKQSNQLLLDSSDRLSEMMMTMLNKTRTSTFDDDCDCDSDLEE